MAKRSIPALVTELERGPAQLASLEARLTTTMRYAHLAPDDGGEMFRALDRSASAHRQEAQDPDPHGNSMATGAREPRQATSS